MFASGTASASPPDKAPADAVAGKPKPLLRDFMGLNVHTISFKPALYRPVCRLVRDYHNFDWDVSPDTSTPTHFPMSANGIDWEKLYGSWKQLGYDIDVCVQFGGKSQDKWKDIPRDAYAYGLAFAKFFGPSGPNKLAGSVEIGNEPGNYPDATYRAVFENMAKGVREGDPKLKIVTCNAVLGKSEAYAKSISSIAGLESLWDVFNIHTYAFAEQYPTWRRSFPEDPTIAYLKPITETIAWRNEHAPGKQIWVTEFGWDASTKPPPPTGDFSKWMSSTETQQAQYLVRSFLVFSAMDVDRAYIYYFNDDDEPMLHGSSGLTRKYVPKPSFYAVAHLYSTLGNYRFSRIVSNEPGALRVYEYRSGTDPNQRVWVAWSPTGAGRQAEVTLPSPNGTVTRAERMPLHEGAAESVAWQSLQSGEVKIPVTESPVYLWIRDP